MGRYKIWQPDMGQTEADAVLISAHWVKNAVEEWADRDDWNSNEFHIVGGQPATVMVRCLDIEGTQPREWIVSGESVRQYTAQLKTAPAKTPPHRRKLP